jgi:hypothetical protein
MPGAHEAPGFSMIGVGFPQDARKTLPEPGSSLAAARTARR